MVFAIASRDLGPDRRPHRAAQGDLLGRRGLEPRHHRLGVVAFVRILLIFRGIVGVGEGAYGPSANTLLSRPLPRKARPRARHLQHRHGVRRDQRARARELLAAIMDWHRVFWIAGGPSVLLAASVAFIADTRAPQSPDGCPRALICARRPT